MSKGEKNSQAVGFLPSLALASSRDPSGTTKILGLSFRFLARSKMAYEKSPQFIGGHGLLFRLCARRNRKSLKIALGMSIVRGFPV